MRQKWEIVSTNCLHVLSWHIHWIHYVITRHAIWNTSQTYTNEIWTHGQRCHWLSMQMKNVPYFERSMCRHVSNKLTVYLCIKWGWYNDGLRKYLLNWYRSRVNVRGEWFHKSVYITPLANTYTGVALFTIMWHIRMVHITYCDTTAWCILHAVNRHILSPGLFWSYNSPWRIQMGKWTINLNHSDNTAPLDLESADTTLTMVDTDVRLSSGQW